jgi:hypothetical protein
MFCVLGPAVIHGVIHDLNVLVISFDYQEDCSEHRSKLASSDTSIDSIRFTKAVSCTESPMDRSIDASSSQQNSRDASIRRPNVSSNRQDGKTPTSTHQEHLPSIGNFKQ